MYTRVRGVFAARVADWSYVWSQLSRLPTLTAHGIKLNLRVAILMIQALIVIGLTCKSSVRPTYRTLSKNKFCENFKKKMLFLKNRQRNKKYTLTNFLTEEKL